MCLENFFSRNYSKYNKKNDYFYDFHVSYCIENTTVENRNTMLHLLSLHTLFSSLPFSYVFSCIALSRVQASVPDANLSPSIRVPAWRAGSRSVSVCVSGGGMSLVVLGRGSNHRITVAKHTTGGRRITRRMGHLCACVQSEASAWACHLAITRVIPVKFTE